MLVALRCRSMESGSNWTMLGDAGVSFLNCGKRIRASASTTLLATTKKNTSWTMRMSMTRGAY
jgi:hypothetical protein